MVDVTQLLAGEIDEKLVTGFVVQYHASIAT